MDNLNINRAFAKSKRAHRAIEKIARTPEVTGGIPNSFLAADALAELESAAADLREFLEVPKAYTVITTRTIFGHPPKVYPTVVHGALGAVHAEQQAILHLGEEFKAIATIEGDHTAHADEYGIGYVINLK